MSVWCWCCVAILFLRREGMFVFSWVCRHQEEVTERQAQCPAFNNIKVWLGPIITAAPSNRPPEFLISPAPRLIFFAFIPPPFSLSPAPVSCFPSFFPLAFLNILFVIFRAEK